MATRVAGLSGGAFIVWMTLLVPFVPVSYGIGRAVDRWWFGVVAAGLLWAVAWLILRVSAG